MSTSQTSAATAFLKARCPRCRRGPIFQGSMYGFNVQKTNEHCPHCGVKFEIEPGYFYVAMYISYALNVAELVTLGILTYLVSGESESAWIYIAVLLSSILILAPFNYRYSRVILLHWMTPRLRYLPELDRPKTSGKN